MAATTFYGKSGRTFLTKEESDAAESARLNFAAMKEAISASRKIGGPTDELQRLVAQISQESQKS